MARKKVTELGITQGDILRAAAVALEERHFTFSCLAVGAGGDAEKSCITFNETRQFYAKLMTPRKRPHPYSGEWLVPQDFDRRSPGSERAKNLRILAVCFAAAVADRPL